MGWSLGSEIDDAAKSAASGFEMTDKAKDRATRQKLAAEGKASKEKSTVESFKRGGYVGARSSGKRMYAKGGMVKGKSCG